MPGMDGLTLVRTLRKMKPLVKVVLTTGRDEDCESEEVALLEVDACLTKPFTRQILLENLERILEAPAHE